MKTESTFVDLRVLALLAVLVGVSYGNGLQNDFVGDDYPIIVMNRSITTVEAIPALFTGEYWANYRGSYEAGPDKSLGLYRPLPMVTYTLNYAVGGLNPMGYHLANFLLHLLVSWLLYLIALWIGMIWEAALVAAAMFAVHPLHIEAVTGIVGRAEILMAAGVLGAVWGHLSGRRAVSLVCFATGLLAKEQAMVLPVLLLLYEGSVFCHSSKERTWRAWKAWLVGASRRLSGYVAVLLAYLFIRATVLGGFPLPPPYPIENPLFALTGHSRLLTAIKVAGMYMKLFIWPATLVADYSSNSISAAHSPFEPLVLLGGAAWGGMLVLAVWSFARSPRVFFAAAIGILAFLPTSNLIVLIGTIMAERLFYLPSVGLCLLVGLAYEGIAKSTERRTMIGEPRPLSAVRRIPVFVLQVVLVGLCVILTARTVVRNRDWKDDERLYRTVVEKFPTNAKAYIFLAGALRLKDQTLAALEAYDLAMKFNPLYPVQDAAFNAERGSMLLKVGRVPEAVAAFEQAVTLDPKWGRIRHQLGLAHAMLGNFDKAETILRYAIKLTPTSPDGYHTLSVMLVSQGRYQEALVAAEDALQRDPSHPWAMVDRGIALEGLKRPDEARAIYEGVLNSRTRPEYRPALEEARERLTAMREEPATPRCLPGMIRCK